MNNPNDRYLTPTYGSPKSPFTSPTIANTSPLAMTRSASYDPHRVLGYFDIPSRSAPSSPQASYIPYSPISRGPSPARDSRKSREYNYSNHSGSDFEDALVGFSLVPNWLKTAMEQDQPTKKSSTLRPTLPPKTSSASSLNSPNSITTMSTPSTEATPVTPRTPQLNLAIPQADNFNSPKRRNSKPTQAEDEDRRYWEEEEDEGYWGEMEQDEEDLEEEYRSRR